MPCLCLIWRCRPDAQNRASSDAMAWICYLVCPGRLAKEGPQGEVRQNTAKQRRSIMHTGTARTSCGL